MNRNYLAPAVTVEDIKIEKGFATSAVDTYSIEDFSYDGEGDNTAW